MSRRRTLIGIVGAFVALAGLLDGAAVRAEWTWYGQREGVQGNFFHSIADDSSGGLWAQDGSLGYLVSWEPEGWDSSEDPILSALPISRWERSLLSPAPGGGVFGTVYAIFPFDEAFFVFNTNPSARRRSWLLPGQPYGLAAVAPDSLWVASTQGLFELGPSSPGFGTFPAPSPLPLPEPARVVTLLPEGPGRIWAILSAQPCPTCPMSGETVGVFENGQWTIPPGWPGGQAIGMVPIAGGLCVLEDGARASILSNGTWRSIRLPGTPVAWAADGDSGLLIVSDNRIHRYSQGAWRSIESQEVFGVGALEVDSEGVLWLAAYNGLGRIGRLAGDHWSRSYFVHDQPGALEGAVGRDRRGRNWYQREDSLFATDGLDIERHWLGARQPGSIRSFVRQVGETAAGAIWAATEAGPRILLDGGWQPFSGGGPGSSPVVGMREGPPGTAWFEEEGTHRLLRVDPDSIRSFTPPIVAEGGAFRNFTVDRLGRAWVATDRGCEVLVDGAWTRYDGKSGIASEGVILIHEAPDGAIWAPSDGVGGIARFHNGSWTTWPVLPIPGVTQTWVYEMLSDREGAVWCFGDWLGYKNEGGRFVARYRDGEWLTSSNFPCATSNGPFRLALTGDGRGCLVQLGSTMCVTSLGEEGVFRTFISDLPVPADVRGIVGQDAFGAIQCHADSGAWTYWMDRDAPRTWLVASPLPLGSARTVTALARTAREDAADVEFSFKLGDGAWGPFAASPQWTSPLLADGLHEISARARDRSGNVDPTPARQAFTVDATQPAIEIVRPRPGDVLRGEVEVESRVSDAHPAEHELSLQPSGFAACAAPDSTPIGSGVGAADDPWQVRFDSSSLCDGSYEIVLHAEDGVGLFSRTSIPVVIDNHAPFVEETSPVVATPGRADTVFSVDGAARLILPPNALAEQSTVTLDARPSDLPGDPPPGISFAAAYRLHWTGLPLQRSGILEFDLTRMTNPTPESGHPAVYRLDDTQALRVGGTLDGSIVAIPVREPGSYLVAFESSTPPASSSGGSSVEFTPRVVSFGRLAGALAHGLAISFHLSVPEHVSIAIYNRAGRRVREVWDGSMGSGLQVVRWDGLDEAGTRVRDGIYLVHVERGGLRTVHSITVVP